MKASKMISGLLILLAVIIGIVSILLCTFAVTQKPILISEPREASAAARRVMDAISQGDYAAASAEMQGKPDLGVNREPGDTVGKLLWSEFINSFTYEFQGSCYAVGSGMALDVTVSYLDFDSVIGSAGSRTGEMLKQRARDAEDPSEIYDEDNNYRQELVDEVLRAAAEQAIREDGKTVTKELTLQLVHENDSWLVVPDSALIYVISGGTAGEMAEGER